MDGASNGEKGDGELGGGPILLLVNRYPGLLQYGDKFGEAPPLEEDPELESEGIRSLSLSIMMTFQDIIRLARNLTAFYFSAM